MNKKLLNDLNIGFTTDEMLRIIDLAIRRIVENGEENYSPQEQVMFYVMCEIKHGHGVGKLG